MVNAINCRIPCARVSNGDGGLPRDKAYTKKAIARCLEEEFLAHGYEKASLNRVSAKVGITTAALYKHFKNKQDMFHYLVADTLDAFHDLANGGLDQLNADSAYNPFADDWAVTWIDFIYEHFRGMKLLICCSKGSDLESFEEDVIQMEAKSNRAYAEALRASGRLTRVLPDMQWHMLATAYVRLLFETVRHDMTRDEALTHARFVSELLYPGWEKILGLRG